MATKKGLDSTGKVRAAPAAEPQDFFRAIFERANCGIVLVSLDERISAVNPMWCTMLGYSREELVGRSVFDITDPSDHDLCRYVIQAAQRSQGWSGEKRYIRKDGSSLWGEVHASLLRDPDGNPQHFLAIIQDVSGRKMVEAKLSQRMKYGELLHTSTLAANESGSFEGALKTCLTAICRELGWDLGNALLVRAEDLRLVSSSLWHGSAKERFAAFIEASDNLEFVAGLGLPGRVLAEKRTVTIMDVTKEPNFPRAAIAAQVGLRGAMGFPVIVGEEVAAVIEVYSQAESHPDQAQEDLFSQIGMHLGRIVERERLAEQLRQSQKMEAMGRLAGGVAHDFNNLLTAINGYSEMVLKALSTGTLEHGRVLEIKKAGERASALTEQLLAFSRRQVVKASALDLNEAVREIEKMLQRVIGEDIELVTALESNLGKVWVNSGQIEQVIMNLAVNSRDAMSQGGRLTIETANHESLSRIIDNRPRQLDHPYVRLSVSDTGHGMSEEVKQHIFEPFFTTKEKGRGTGLGLATVYGVVKQLQGEIRVESEPGRGTRVDIFLPRMTEAVESESGGELRVVALTGTETILVAEDDEAVRQLVVAILGGSGYTVLTACGASEALMVSQSYHGKIHLLLTDVVMHEASGRELAEALVKDRPEMRVLYMSGYTEDAIIHRGVRQKSMNFLNKPFGTDTLREKVRSVLDSPAKPRDLEI